MICWCRRPITFIDGAWRTRDGGDAGEAHDIDACFDIHIGKTKRPRLSRERQVAAP